MNNSLPKTIYLKDYRPVPFEVENICLTFNLSDNETLVNSKINFVRNSISRSFYINDMEAYNRIDLNGVDLKLKKIHLDGVPLSKDQYKIENDILTISNLNLEKFQLEIENEIDPLNNKTLEGLYKSGSIFCTQNEAEGFRRITYYLDRPDVMTKFTTKIIADKKNYPVLLSNGNLIEKGDLSNGQHYAIWEDPFKKPAYLYALVAGDLGMIEDSFVTMSNRKIQLEIYCDKGNEYKCKFAMESLKRSMKWDEDRFGREYDLDRFMIVAVGSFNAGAMENKGLNIFNSALVLADSKSETDGNFLRIDGVVAHEYFHNWTGNRITCRDWFQLTLKEGLTVFRDQEYTSDVYSRATQRIQDVIDLRASQFPEDAGPLSHPIKPSEYIEINNFYTMTVYEKGAEVIRMIYSLLGRDGFRKGMDKYFELFDGGAVTTEDFIHAMSVGNNNYDFEQFKNWYNQSGTPTVTVEWSHDAKSEKFNLVIKQKGKENQKPFFFPFKVALYDVNGNELVEKLLIISKTEEVFSFNEIKKMPYVSLNREFTAPVNVKAPYTIEDLAFLMSFDKDHFARFEAAQELQKQVVNSLIDGSIQAVPDFYINAYGKIINDKDIDDSFKTLLMRVIGESEINQNQPILLVKETAKALDHLKTTLAKHFKKEFLNIFNERNKKVPYVFSAKDSARRSLKNLAIRTLMYTKDKDVLDLLIKQYENSDNMTDGFTAFAALCDQDLINPDIYILDFYNKWNHDSLVIQKWFAAQAKANQKDSFDRVVKLIKHSSFDKTVPNIVRAVLGSFMTTLEQYHHESGRGYKFISSMIADIDTFNPSLSSRLATGAYEDYRRLPENLKVHMKSELDNLLAKKLSKNLFEIVSKIAKS